MSDQRTSPRTDLILLLSRILLMVLFLVAGFSKLMAFGGATAYFSGIGVPAPVAAAALAIAIELASGIAIVAGIFTRPLALALVCYTFVTALLGHHFWTMSGAAQAGNLIHFNKNLAIMGGFLLLYVTGAGRYSVDSRMGRAT